MDFLDEVLADDGVVQREVTIGGKTGTVYLRRISAGEKKKLLSGMKVNHVVGKDGSVEIDMGQNEAQRHQWVLYSVCNADGTRRFKSLADVEKVPSHKLEALAEAAIAVNSEVDAGNS